MTNTYKTNEINKQMGATDQAQTTFKPNWRLKVCAFALDRKYRPRKQETSLNTQHNITAIYLFFWNCEFNTFYKMVPITLHCLFSAKTHKKYLT